MPKERSQQLIEREKAAAKRGLEACLAGDYETAKQFWEELAESENVTAMIDLGRLHARRLISDAKTEDALQL